MTYINVHHEGLEQRCIMALAGLERRNAIDDREAKRESWEYANQWRLWIAKVTLGIVHPRLYSIEEAWDMDFLGILPSQFRDNTKERIQTILQMARTITASPDPMVRVSRKDFALITAWAQHFYEEY